MNIKQLKKDNTNQLRNVIQELQKLRGMKYKENMIKYLEKERQARYTLDDYYCGILNREDKIRKTLNELMNR